MWEDVKRSLKVLGWLAVLVCVIAIINGCATSVAYKDADCQVTMRGYMWAASAPENAKLGCRE